MRTLILGIAVLSLLSSGCLTLNAAHNRRHIRAVREEVRELHRDIDKTLFGLDRYPAEE